MRSARQSAKRQKRGPVWGTNTDLGSSSFLCAGSVAPYPFRGASVSLHAGKGPELSSRRIAPRIKAVYDNLLLNVLPSYDV